jgi:predicted ATPase
MAAWLFESRACRRRSGAQPGTRDHTSWYVDAYLSWTIFIRILCGHYAIASALIEELAALANEKDTAFWKAWGMMTKGWLVALTGKASDAVHEISFGIAAWRATDATMCVPFYTSCLATAYAQLGQFEEAQRAMRDAMAGTERTKETWFEAEIHRMAGEIALKSPGLGGAKAEIRFQHALSAARGQKAKSWELRAAMSLAQLWRDQGKRDEARELLAPIYGWFTEGFDTLDLKEAKGLLDRLAP